jgi:DUF438 domain-containing protein
MSEHIDNDTRRKNKLAGLVRRLHEGATVEEVKGEFAALLQEVGAEEIAEVEQALIADGVPEQEIKQLYDVHVAIFRDSLDAQARPEVTPGHPVHTFVQDNAAAAQAVTGLLSLDTGALAPQQVNLLLTHLPVDVTYVDANDEVRFFSQTKERIFPRSPAIIGRKVQQCHPPASVHRVQQILDDFRLGRRDEAEFWIQMKAPEARFIHIRYFALRDETGTYRGTLEVSQDVTAIRALEGEKRLLDEG